MLDLRGFKRKERNMKEESLFRGQRLDNKEWVEGDYIASDFISPWKMENYM